MSLVDTIEKVCNVFQEDETSSQDGRIACWQIIVASIANDAQGDGEAASLHLARELDIALQQLAKLCRFVRPLRGEETIQ